MTVHLDAFSAMTGASLFTHANEPRWRYNKSESLIKADEYDVFDALLTHEPERHLERFEKMVGALAFTGFRQDGKAARAHGRFQRLWNLLPWRPTFQQTVWVMANKAMK